MSLLGGGLQGVRVKENEKGGLRKKMKVATDILVKFLTVATIKVGSARK